MAAWSDEEIREVRARIDRTLADTAGVVAETRRMAADTRELAASWKRRRALVRGRAANDFGTFAAQ